MRRLSVFVALLGGTVFLVAPASAQASAPAGTSTTFTNIMRIDNSDLNWWNGLLKSNGGRHTWRQWANASAPLAQDDAKIATRLLSFSWPRRVRDDVQTIILAKINEGAAWAASTKAYGDGNVHEATLAQDRVTTFNVRSHRAENRVRAAFGLKPL
jgi:hypothetical protein